MFGIGWAELLVIALVIVLVVKPEQLPEVAKTLGRFYGQIQRLIYESRTALDREKEEIKRAVETPPNAVEAEEKKEADEPAALKEGKDEPEK